MFVTVLKPKTLKSALEYNMAEVHSREHSSRSVPSYAAKNLD
jgi:hypothetical protein